MRRMQEDRRRRIASPSTLSYRGLGHRGSSGLSERRQGRPPWIQPRQRWLRLRSTPPQFLRVSPGYCLGCRRVTPPFRGKTPGPSGAAAFADPRARAVPAEHPRWPPCNRPRPPCGQDQRRVWANWRAFCSRVFATRRLTLDVCSLIAFRLVFLQALEADRLDVAARPAPAATGGLARWS